MQFYYMLDIHGAETTGDSSCSGMMDIGYMENPRACQMALRACV